MRGFTWNDALRGNIYIFAVWTIISTIVGSDGALKNRNLINLPLWDGPPALITLEINSQSTNDTGASYYDTLQQKRKTSRQGNEANQSFPYRGSTSRHERLAKRASPGYLVDNVVVLGPIFYNFFVPLETTDVALEIAGEQMNERERVAPNTTLLYTLIGNPNITDDYCQPNCRMRQYLKDGDEFDTLHALWKYCHSHPNEIVTYLHDKGSFHNNENNMKVRRIGTKAALECRALMQQHPRKCNVCTSKFWMMPQFHGSANMWSTKCSYVSSSLMSPRIYSAALLSMYNVTLLHPNHSETGKYACLRPQSMAPNHLGIGRYSNERWIFSHPDVQPCDVLPMHLGQAPSDVSQKWVPRLQRSPTSKNQGFRFGPGKASYSRLVGRLFEWQYLYGKSPPNTSWIWKEFQNFQDGDDKWMASCLSKSNTTRQDALTTKLLRELLPT